MQSCREAAVLPALKAHERKQGARDASSAALIRAVKKAIAETPPGPPPSDESTRLQDALKAASSSPQHAIPSIAARLLPRAPASLNEPGEGDDPTARLSSLLFRAAISAQSCPLNVKYIGNHVHMTWTRELDTLRMEESLPILFDGLTDLNPAVSEATVPRIADLVGRDAEATLTVLPDLIPPIVSTLNCGIPRKVAAACRVTEYIVLCKPSMGKHLVEYFPALLPPLAKYMGAWGLCVCVCVCVCT
jgi:hypothetical protein